MEFTELVYRNCERGIPKLKLPFQVIPLRGMRDTHFNTERD